MLRYEPAEPKLKAFVQEARWLSDAGWRMGKAIRRTVRLGDFCRSFLPERIFRFAARRTESGMSHGTTKSGAVISGDMILGLKLVWSQVAAGLRSPFRQKGPTSARTAIRHGVMRVLKTVVDGARLYRWADAAPLAGCLCVFIIRCPEIWSRDRAARGR